MVVFVAMLLTQDPGLQQAPEYFQVEKLIPESRVETLKYTHSAKGFPAR